MGGLAPTERDIIDTAGRGDERGVTSVADCASFARMDPAQRRATYADLLQVPDRFIAEILDGELLTAPRPAFSHARAALVIIQDLSPFDRPRGDADEPGGWWFLFEPELHLGADILVPDIAAWRHENMPPAKNLAYTDRAPDWICEVVSPSTGRTDRVRKMPIYARERVGHVWLVDPLQRTLEVYRRQESGWFVVGSHGDMEHVHAEPFETLEIDISRWWLEHAE